jgi:hypothetical protein
MTRAKTICDFSKQDVCMCVCVWQRESYVFFSSFVQNNKEKSIEFFCSFSKKWQSFFEQKQVVCVLPFLCGFLEKRNLFIFSKKTSYFNMQVQSLQSLVE